MNTVFDRLCAAVGLVVLTPLFAIAAAIILLEDGSPVFFRQKRIGRHAETFWLWKFRSMRVTSSGPKVTAAGDSRLLCVGALLRKYKIDELPQLWNVLKGEMSLVGPRPEVPEFVDPSSAVWRQVLEARPGITDLATLTYRNEEDILGTADNPEQYYRQHILPKKLQVTIEYLSYRSFSSDIRVLLKTMRYSVAPRGFDAARVAAAFSKRPLDCVSNNHSEPSNHAR